MRVATARAEMIPLRSDSPSYPGVFSAGREALRLMERLSGKSGPGMSAGGNAVKLGLAGFRILVGRQIRKM
jgi:hypothetical protein